MKNTVRTMTSVQNKFRRHSIIQKLSSENQKKIYDSLDGRKLSDLRGIIQKLHPLEEFVMVSNLLASMTDWNVKELADMTHEVVREYAHDRITFEGLEKVARTHSTIFFDKFEKSSEYNPDLKFSVSSGDCKYHDDAVVVCL